MTAKAHTLSPVPDPDALIADMGARAPMSAISASGSGTGDRVWALAVMRAPYHALRGR